MRQHSRFFLAVAVLGLALRLIFFFYFPAITDDSRVYADIATNWLQHGVYAETQSGEVVPTFARLPGYPAFLAAIFAVFGLGNFKAVLLIQIVLDLLTCLLVADLARRVLSDRAALASFLLSCVCPFLANYSGAALTETLEILFTVTALECAVIGLIALQSNNSAHWSSWIGCGASIAACILLRPDGGILLAGVGLYLLFVLWVRARHDLGIAPVVKAGLTVALVALLPLVPWTLRNLRTLHRFEPLAPRYATDQDELVPHGFNRWVKTWMADFTSVQEFYWAEPGAELDIDKLPSRAFDSPEQRDQTESLLDAYNEDKEMTPELDAQFAQLAAERIHSHRLRYYVALPAIRIADMWLRPRTELLPPDPRWWEFDDEIRSSIAAVILGVANLVYVGLGVVGVVRLPQSVRFLWLFLSFTLLRTVFLGSLENPEPRYTLECYPIVIVLAANALLSRDITSRAGAYQKP